MEHLALEIFDLGGTGSQYAVLPEDANITITDTSEIFANGDVWSHSFTLNVFANAHIFGTSGEVHGSRLHEQIHKRRARLWVEGTPLYLGYLMLDDEVEVDVEGNVEVAFESGQKTFEEMIEGTSAQEVSVGDVVIGVALNRKRVVHFSNEAAFTWDGLAPYANKRDNEWLEGVNGCVFTYYTTNLDNCVTPYTQRWPKLVKSHGTVFDGAGKRIGNRLDADGNVIVDYTNVQTAYDAGHPFCNINICYPLKTVNKSGEEEAARGYTTRLAHGKPTVDGGDNQTRYNNAPNFYLLYFIDRLFKDLGIHIAENQALNVEDLRRVYMLNYGCHYEEIENDSDYFHSNEHTTPEDRPEKPFLSRYGQYYLPMFAGKYLTDNLEGHNELVRTPWDGCKNITVNSDVPGKVLLRNVTVSKDGEARTLTIGSIEGKALGAHKNELLDGYAAFSVSLDRNNIEELTKSYSAYLAYATGENYPNVEISDIINAMKSMFGVRLLFNSDYSTVRIILLRNVFRNQEVQDIACDIVDEDEKIENSIRGFRMTYGKGTDNTSFYYKGFADMFPRTSTTWKDTTDRHDYSQWNLNAEYDFIKQYASAFNRTCYVTPVNGNAYGTQVDEDEDVLFPSLLEWAGFMDAEDGDCSQPESEGKTIEEVQCGATPVLMNEVGVVYASLFSGDIKAPSPEDYQLAQNIATFGRATKESTVPANNGRAQNESTGEWFTVMGDLDVYISEGFQIRLEDNYAISNGGTPFDEADPGLCFGIMRSSGDDAYVRYYGDVDDGEGNDAWEVEPGSGAVSHPDTCDSYGNEWDYDGSFTVTPADAPAKLEELFPNSDAPFYDADMGYITGTTCIKCRSNDGVPEAETVLIATAYSNAGTVLYWQTIRQWMNYTASELMEMSRTGGHFIVEVGSSQERGSTLVQLCKLAYGGSTEPMTIDNGVGSRYGRFSLKLRAEKPNPYFDPKTEEGFGNRRYLEIEKLNLRGRGLADQFYKEYSYWVRNARIVKRTVRMTLAQLLTIDKTKRVRVGDVTGFIRKTQYSVSNKTGLGNVVLEIMYI